MGLTYASFIKNRADENTTMELNPGSNVDYEDLVLKHSPFAYYLVNYVTQKFEFIHNCGVLGYADSDFIAGGLRESLQNIHPDDFRVISNEVFPYIWDFVASIPDDQGDYRYSVNYRYKRKDQSYMHLQQHITFLDFDNHRIPVRNLSFIYDISRWKTDNSIDLIITRLKENDESIAVQKKYFQEANPLASAITD